MFDPAPFDEVEATLGVDPSVLSYDELGALAVRLGVYRDRVTAKLVEVAMEAERTSAFAHAPLAASTADWLEKTSLLRRSQARADAFLARDLIPLQAIRTALHLGVISVEEARVLCRPMRSPRLRRVYPDHEADVLAELLAVDRVLWDRIMAIVVDRLDDGPAPAGDPDRNVGHIDRQPNGRWHLDADLDLVDGAEVDAVIESIVRQLRAGTGHEGADAPTRSRLVGDAIVEMARRAAGHPDCANTLTEVSILVPHDACHPDDHTDDEPTRRDTPTWTWDGDDSDETGAANDTGTTGASTATDRSDTADATPTAPSIDDGSGAAVAPADAATTGSDTTDHHAGDAGCCGHSDDGNRGHDREPRRRGRPATIGGFPLTKARLHELLCTSILRGVVVASDGAILRLGRSTRHPSNELRLYLALRDGGCTFPGCTKAPAQCHLHHLRFWRHDGPTDHDNLILLCPRHHALLHSGLWHARLHPDASVTWTHTRTGVHHTRHPPWHLHHLVDTTLAT